MLRQSNGVRCACAGLLLAGAVNGVCVAEELHNRFNPYETFAPLVLPQAANTLRSGSGVPGPAYWQNSADYRIRAVLDAWQKQLSAQEVITYCNHSPDALDTLWVQLDQNRYRADSRARAADPGGSSPVTEGFVLEQVEIEQNGPRGPAAYRVSDTRMQIALQKPLAPVNGCLRLQIRYHYTIPGASGGRTSWITTRNGEIFRIAQWYPRMAVYDDLRGWDTLPYLDNEFYLEYGSFDYAVTVPADMLVAGSGELLNAGEMLTALERQRLEAARHSDATVSIRSAAELQSNDAQAGSAGTRTWHFRMDHTRDVAFGASRAFIWDAARMRLPGAHPALAMSFYPIESAGAGAWGRSTEFVKAAVENFSQHWGTYPYPTAINIAGGSQGGMEYPGVAFDGVRDAGKALFSVTTHEFGHTWFPMMVGFNERRDAWMDEGFNTFIDVLATDTFNHGEFAPKRDTEFAPGAGNPVDEIIPILEDHEAPTLMDPPDEIPDRFGHPIPYFKSALGLMLLRNEVLGPERFDSALRHFIQHWQFRHPAPADFFRALQSEAGEDLSWFWRGWYFNNWTLDLAVTRIEYVKHDPGRGALVTLENRDRLVLPVTLQIELADGTQRRQVVPVETWMAQKVVTLPIDSHQRIKRVTLDPEHVLPDIDRRNNELRGP